MIERLRPWFPWLKALFSLAILVGVGALFWRAIDNDDLRRADPSRPPWQVLATQLTEARPTDLVLAGLAYLAGLGCCAAFWLSLLRRLGGHLDFWPGLRAYTISHLGKYPPGKGWALVLRVALSAQAGTRPGLAALSGAYETLTMMASGAIVAAVLLTLRPSDDPHHLWWALALFVVAGMPILPGVFNRIVYHLSRRFVRGDTLPSIGIGTLGAGLALTSSCWIFFGVSLIAVLRSLEPQPGPIDLSLCLNCIAIVAVSYVAGFVSSTPGGLGVRELLMQTFLAPRLGDLRAVVAVILLRLLWTAAELIAAAAIYWAPHRNRAAQPDRAAVTDPLPDPAATALYPELTSSTNQPPP